MTGVRTTNVSPRNSWATLPSARANSVRSHRRQINLRGSRVVFMAVNIDKNIRLQGELQISAFSEVVAGPGKGPKFQALDLGFIGTLRWSSARVACRRIGRHQLSEEFSQEFDQRIFVSDGQILEISNQVFGQRKLNVPRGNSGQSLA